MKLPSPAQFAELLNKSILPNEAKEIILKELPRLSNRQIAEIYKKLQEEQDKINKAKAEFSSKISLAEVKFENNLQELKEKAKKASQ